MQRNRLIIPFVILVLSSFSGKAQIIAPTADYADTASYSYLRGVDTLYFFASGNVFTYIAVDTSSGKPDSFMWEKFTPGAGYQPFDSTSYELPVNPSSTGTGYKLTTHKNGADSISRCWVFTYDFSCAILTKDDHDTLLTGAYTGECNRYGPIQVKIASDTIKYFDPVSFDPLFYDFNYKYKWSQSIIDVDNHSRVSNRGVIGTNLKFYIEDAFYEDMWYWITVTDSLGVKRYDSVWVKSIQPHADFKFDYIQLDNKEYYPDKDTNYYFFYGKAGNYTAKSAPAIYLFTNKSQNADKYLWDFGDSTTFSTTKDSVLKIYDHWSDNYTVTLTAIKIVDWSGKQCTDPYTPEEVISIDKPVLQAPNFFIVNSPNYPAWRFYDVSITDFEISIFSRYGIRVHHFKGNIRNWDGWDGRINNSGNYASTGVYYYVVKKITSVNNIDPTIENGDKWQSSSNNSSSSQSSQTGTTSSTGTNTTSKTKNLNNNEYRGFFHVFNNSN